MEKACKAGETTFTRQVKDMKTVEYAQFDGMCQGPFIPIRADEHGQQKYGIQLPGVGKAAWCLSGEETFESCVERSHEKKEKQRGEMREERRGERREEKRERRGERVVEGVPPGPGMPQKTRPGTPSNSKDLTGSTGPPPKINLGTALQERPNPLQERPNPTNPDWKNLFNWNEIEALPEKIYKHNWG